MTDHGQKARRETFERIYKQGGWPGSKESVSGRGSEVAATEMLRADLEGWIAQRLDVYTFLDAPCGDYNWMRLVKFRENIRYIGGDIVKDLIDVLNERYKTETKTFMQLDVVTDELPACDAWFCRDLLIHLPLEDGVRVVRKFRNSPIKYFLSTTFPAMNNDREIDYGKVRAVNVEIPPFNLGRPMMMLRDPDPAQFNAEPSRVRKFIGVWANTQDGHRPALTDKDVGE